MNREHFVHIMDKAIFMVICLYSVSICLDPHIHFTNIAFGLALLRVCLRRPQLRIQKYHLQLIGIFLLALLPSVFFNDVKTTYIQNLMYYRSNFLSPLLLGTVVCLLGFSMKQLKIWISLTFISLLMNNLVIIWQGCQGATRPAGLAGSYMFVGGMTLFLLPMLMALLLKADFRRKRICFFFMSAVALSTLPAILYNGTRIAWIGLFLLGIFLLPLLTQNVKRGVLQVLLGVLVAASVFAMNPALQQRLDSINDMQNQSNSERLLMWKSASKMFWDHPLVGVGIGNYADQYQTSYILPEAKEREQRHPHNVMLSILSQAGIIGGLAYLGMFGYFLGESLLSWRRTKNLPALLFLLATLGYLINSLTDCNFGGPFLTPLNNFYYFLLAIYLTASGHIKSREGAGPLALKDLEKQLKNTVRTREVHDFSVPGADRQQLHIGYGIDENYIRCLAVSIASICENNRDLALSFHVLAKGLNAESKQHLLTVIEQGASKLFLYDIDPVIFSQLPTQVHFPPAIYFRYILPFVLPQVQQILYIDADIINLSSLRGLLTTPLDDHVAAAVMDLPWMVKKRNKALGLKDHKYFNSGVLWIDIVRWNQFGVLEKTMQVLRQNPARFRYPDQDALNLVLQGKMAYLPWQYNCLAEAQGDRAEAVLLHFAAHPKPWNIAWPISPFARQCTAMLYRQYECGTPWADAPLQLPQNYKEMKVYATCLWKVKQYRQSVGWYGRYLLTKFFY